MSENREKHHFNKYPNHPWLKSRKEIEDWLLDNLKYKTKNDVVYKAITKSFLDDNFIIDDELKVHLIGKEMSLRLFDLLGTNGYIPVQFGRLTKAEFECDYVGLKSLIGTPINATELDFNGNSLEGLEGLSSEIECIVDLSYNSIKSFENMPVFKNSKSVILYLTENPINSWDGFTMCKEITWWESSGTDYTYNLIANSKKDLEIDFSAMSSCRLFNHYSDIESKQFVESARKVVSEMKKMKKKLEIKLVFNNNNNKRKI